MGSNDPPRPKASFSSLPPELRLYIWQLTFEPQTISISIHSLYAERPTTTPLLGPCAYIVVKAKHGFETRHPKLQSLYFGEDPEAWAPAPPGPLALHVCRESRSIALGRYELAFGGKELYNGRKTPLTELWDEKQLPQSKVWVDFKRDTIFLLRAYERLSNMTNHLGEDVTKIQNLAVDGTERKMVMFRGFRGVRRVLKLELGQFRSLKTLGVFTGSMEDSETVRRQLVKDFATQEATDQEWKIGVPAVVVIQPFEYKTIHWQDSTHEEVCIREDLASKMLHAQS